MNVADFIKRGIIKRSSPDKQLAISLINQTKEDRAFFDTLKLTERSARKMASNYYDFLRSILEAMAAIDGYKIYNHEAFTAYLEEKGEKENKDKFDRLRKIRNSINYYGKTLSIEEAEEIISDIKKMIDYLLDKYLKNIKEEIKE